MRARLFVVLALTLVWPGRSAAQEQAQLQALLQQVSEHSGRVIVGFKPPEAARGVPAPGVVALAATQVADLARQKLENRGAQIRRHLRIVPAVAATLDTALVRQLLADPWVEYVEPDWPVEPVDLGARPWDAERARATVLPDATATLVSQSVPWGVDQINAPLVWATTTGSGVRVGIIDSGIDKDHPDLSVAGGINLVTGLETPEEWNDDAPFCDGHGTHVAGTVAALDNDDFVVGVAHGVELYALRVFDPPPGFGCGAATSDIIAAVEWAADDGTGARRLDVINLSLGGGQASQAAADAFASAYANGVVIVASSGNGSGPVIYPAAYPSVIAVAATDGSDTRVWFSNYGPEVEYAAPGWDVPSTLPGPDVGFFSGTSQASPHVAGVAALLRGVDAALTPDDVRDYLRRGAVDLSPGGRDDYTGHGRVDALASVNALTGSAVTLAALPATVGFNSFAAATAPTTDVQLEASGGNVGWTASANRSWVSLSATSGTASPGSPSTLGVGIDPAGLSVGVHVADVTIESGDAANTPFTIQVRVNVAETMVALDDAVAGRIEQRGQRNRYYFDGTAGQYVDIAQVWDYSNDDPLFDPHLRLYGPDGAKLIESDISFEAGGYLQALIAGYQLPADGTYVVETGAWLDRDTGDYVLKLRESGPIGAVDILGTFVGAPQDGSPATFPMQVANIGRGTLGYTVTSAYPWLSATPASGSVTPSPAAAVAFGGRDRAGYRQQDRWTTPPNIPDEFKPFIPTPENVRDKLLQMAPPEIRQRLPQQGIPIVRAPTALDAVAQAATLTVTADPAGLRQEWYSGGFFIEFDDTWFCGVAVPETDPNEEEPGCGRVFVSVSFRVMAPETEVVAEPLYWATGAGRSAGGEAVIATSGLGFFEGLPSAGPQLLLFNIDGTLADARGVDFDPYPGGIAPDRDGNLYVGSWWDMRVTKVDPTGAATTFADDLPLWPNYIARAGDDNFYLSGCSGYVYRLSGDGSLVSPFGPYLGCPAGLDYDPAAGILWVAVFYDRIVGLALDGSVVAEIQTGDLAMSGLTVGASGLLYVSTFGGDLYTVDPATGTVTGLGREPDSYYGFSVGDLELVDGALFLADFFQAERLRVNDRPPDDVLQVNISPAQVALSSPPGTTPVSRTVELTGPATRFTVLLSETPWVSVSPLSGDVPGSIQVTADPTGLPPGSYTDVVLLDINGASVREIPVVFTIGNAIAVGAELTATLVYGTRDRYRFDGTAGQVVDVALLGDAVSVTPLDDPFVRLYHPDGRLLAFNDDAWLAGGGLNSLIPSVELPVDGTYVIEAGAYYDDDGGDYLLKVRSSGPILAVDLNFGLVRAPEGGTSSTLDVAVFNLGSGEATFTATRSEPWLSISTPGGPTAGPAQLAATLLAAAKPTEVDDEVRARLRLPAGWREGMPPYLDADSARELLARPEGDRHLRFTTRAGAGFAGSDAGEVPAGAVLGRVTADPTDLPIGDYSGIIDLVPDDTWWPFGPSVRVGFRVYTPGSVFASGLIAPAGMDAAQGGELLGVNVDNSGGSVFELQYPSGSLLGAKTTGQGFLDGLTRVREGGWVAARVWDGDLLRVFPDGTTETTDYFGCDLWGVEQGFDGSAYAADPCLSSVWQVTPAGSVTQFSLGLSMYDVATGVDPSSGALTLYLAGDNTVHSFDPTTGAAPLVATLPFDPFDDYAMGIVGGASGLLYVRTWRGIVYSVDPAAGTSELLAVLPNLFTSPISSVALVQNSKLVAPGFFDWETYTVPVDDSPISDALPIAAVQPAEVELFNQEGGTTPFGALVELSNVGAAGSFDWTASVTTSEEVSWLSVNPTSGTVSSPVTLTVSGDPTGLAAGLYQGTVTITPTVGSTQNASVEIAVEFTVVPVATIAINSETQGSLFGAEDLFTFDGTPGQPVDLAVLGDESGTGAQGFPLYDPVVSIFDLQGNLVAEGDDSFEAGGGFNSLIIGFDPPVAGVYVVAVSGYFEYDYGDYVLKLRDAGPIMGVDEVFLSFLAQEGTTTPATFGLEVVNLGTGSLSFTATADPTAAWLSVDPTSGSATPGVVASVLASDALREIQRRHDKGLPVERPDVKEWRTTFGALQNIILPGNAADVLPFAAASVNGAAAEPATGQESTAGAAKLPAPPAEVLKLLRAAERTRGAGKNPGFSADVTASAQAPSSPTMVTVSADPTGLASQILLADVVFAPSDPWFVPEIQVLVDLRVHVPATVANAEPLQSPIGVDANAAGDPVVYEADAEGGQVVTLDEAGAVSERRGIGLYQMLGDVYSLLRTGDDAFLMGGVRRGLASLDDAGAIAVINDYFPAFDLTADNAGNLYGTGTACLYRLAPDGSVTTLSCSFSSVWGVAFNPIDGMLYVADFPDVIWKVDPADGTATQFATLSTAINSPVYLGAMTFGTSGNLYVLDFDIFFGLGGRVLVVPTDGSAVSQLVIPSQAWGLLYDIGLAAGKLLASDLYGDAVWSIPVDDSPVLTQQAVLAVVTAPVAPLSGVTGGAAVTHDITASNTGVVGLAWTASSDQPWLSASPALGSLGAGGSEIVTLIADPASLAPGTHTGSLVFSSPGAVGSPATVEVTFEVAASAEGTVFAMWPTAGIDGLRGGVLTVSLMIDASGASAGVTDYDVNVSWDGAELTFGSAVSGDFGTATLTPNATSLNATATAAAPVAGTATLFTATFTTASDLAPGTKIELSSSFGTLTGSGGTNLLGQLAAPAGRVCVALFPWGDMDRSESVGSNDAVQGLRAAADLSLGPGVSRELGDVERDGDNDASDVVQILRYMVALPTTAPVGEYGLTGCPPAGGKAALAAESVTAPETGAASKTKGLERPDRRKQRR